MMPVYVHIFATEAAPSVSDQRRRIWRSWTPKIVRRLHARRVAGF